MENFSFGIIASTYGLGELVAMLSQLQILWGFILGFLFATLIYGFISTETKTHAYPIPNNHFFDKKNVSWLTYVIVISRAMGVVGLLLFMVFVVISTIRF